jgi:hypothetical protein
METLRIIGFALLLLLYGVVFIAITLTDRDSKKRFSLRALIIAATVIALLLGAFAAVNRHNN